MDKLLLISIVLLFTGTSCKKTEPYASDLDYAYFPIEIGQFVEYKVNEISHDEDLIPSVDSTEYYLKITVGEKILNTAGDSVNKLFFYVKPHIDSTYVLDKVNTIYNNGFQGVYNLDNQKYIKLIFPADIGEVWNLNAYNAFDSADSYVVSKDHPGTVNGQSFTSVLKTQQLDFFSLVDHQQAFEIYAKDIGLVQVHYKNLEINNFDTLDIRKGQEIYWNYQTHGME
jgi:hypothetical protein